MLAASSVRQLSGNIEFGNHVVGYFPLDACAEAYNVLFLCLHLSHVAACVMGAC